MKRLIATFLIMVMVCLVGCSVTSNKGFTYQVETGDKIGIFIDTTDGYDLTSTLPIKFKKDGKKVGEGSFLTEEGYDMYLDAIEDGTYTEISTKERDNIEYIFFEDEDAFYCMVKIDKTDCAILFESDDEDQMEFIDKITYEVKK